MCTRQTGILGFRAVTSYVAARLYINADFDTIEIALSSRKGLEKALNKGFRGQSQASEALLLFLELCRFYAAVWRLLTPQERLRREN